MNADMSAPKSVGVVETQPVTAAGLQTLIERSSRLRFKGSVRTLAAGVEMLRAEPVDVVLVDKSFGSQAILEWLGEVRVAHRNTATVVWGTSITEPEALRLLQSGVRGILRKTAEPEQLLACLSAVAGGANWMEESLFGESQRSERYPRSELTPREQQVLELVEQGMKNKEIARALGIRPGTVKIHLKHIFEKTGVRGRYGLALTGLKEKGMLELAQV